MNRINTLALTLVGILSLLLSSCEKAPFITMTGPRSFNFTRDGGSQTITFTCNRPWSVSSTESWVQITPSSGEASDKDVTVTIKCSPNTTYDPRSATVTVKLEELSESITITQDTGIGLLVSPTTFDLTNAAQTIEIEVQKNVQYSVAIDDESAKWIKQGGTKALTTDKVTFTISANESYGNREGKITFKQLDGDLSQIVTVRQSQTNGLFITTPDYNLSNEAHTLSVEVKANVEFEVTSQAEWIKYVETKALTPSTITLTVEANETYDDRTGTVLVKQKNGDLSGTITVNQKQTDYMTIAPTSFEVSNATETVIIEIKDNVSYSVVIPDEAKSWISVAANTQTKALVDDKVTLAIAQNTTYDDREASVTIKQTDGALSGTVIIKQAYGEGLIVEKTSYEIERQGGAVEVSVNANVDYEVKTEVDWIHFIETKALSSSTVFLTVDENETYDTREGKITISKKDGSLSSQVSIKQAGRIFVASISLDKTSLTLYTGDSEKLAASVLPDNAFNQEINWTSSDENIASVNSEGTVAAKSKGTAQITATAKDGSGKIATCNLTVYQIDIPQVVDLGLSVKWASFNIGASSPEEYGIYYAWGETEPKSNYSYDTYKYGGYNSITKYNNNSKIGTVDNKTVLDPEDDVAHVKLGGSWRMPTDAEFAELTNNCTSERITINGVVGHKFTSKKDGYTDKSIFLPAAGFWLDTKLCNDGSEGNYWCSTIMPSQNDAWQFLLFPGYEAMGKSYPSYESMGNQSRCYGLSVRPVTE